jgi:diguanylate cyclase (GGDEF)-like protein
MTASWFKNLSKKVKNFKNKINVLEDNVLDERRRYRNIFERNLLLEKEITERTEELNQANKSLLTLKHIWSTMNSAEPLSEVLSTVINGLSDELGYLYCFVFQVYNFESGTRLKIRAANENNFSAKMHDILQNSIFSYDIPFNNDDNIVVNAIKSGEIVNIKSFKRLFEGCIPDIEDDKLQAIDDLLGSRSISILPIVVQGDHFGCLVTISVRSEIGHTEKNFLSLFAGQIELAVTIANLFEQIKKQAITDGLTGLYNRRHFDQCLAAEVERATRLNQPFTLITLDLDHLKKINDNFGHSVGDEAIRQIGVILKKNARSVDIAARFGGEEFAIILPGIDIDGGLIAAERLRVAISESLIKDSIPISASIGVATFLKHTDSIAELLELADQAMYSAKKNGRNKVEIATKQEETDWQHLIVNTFVELLVKNKIPAASQIVKDIQANKMQNDNLLEVMKCIYHSLCQSHCTLYHKDDCNGSKFYFVEELAKKLHLSDEEIEKLKIACVLHDIGNLFVPEKYLLKPGPLTKEERKQVLEHPILAAKEILRPLKSTGYIINVIEHHHEHWDGTGYPGLLSGNNIPKGARILFIVDAYFAMINDRPYRKAIPSQKAFEILRNGAGTVWDAELVDMFITLAKTNIPKDISSV